MEQLTEIRIDADCAIRGSAFAVDKVVINTLERVLPRMIRRLLNEHASLLKHARRIMREVETRYANGSVALALPASLANTLTSAEIDSLKEEVGAAVHGEAYTAKRAHPAPQAVQPETGKPSSPDDAPANNSAIMGEELVEPEGREAKADALHPPVTNPAPTTGQAKGGTSHPPSHEPALGSTRVQGGPVLRIAGPVASVQRLLPKSGNDGQSQSPFQAPHGSGSAPSEFGGAPCPSGLPKTEDHGLPRFELAGSPSPVPVKQRILVARLTRATLVTMRGGRHRTVLIPDGINGAATSVGDNLTQKLIGLQVRSSSLCMLRTYKVEPTKA